MTILEQNTMHQVPRIANALERIASALEKLTEVASEESRVRKKREEMRESALHLDGIVRRIRERTDALLRH